MGTSVSRVLTRARRLGALHGAKQSRTTGPFFFARGPRRFGHEGKTDGFYGVDRSLLAARRRARTGATGSGVATLRRRTRRVAARSVGASAGRLARVLGSVSSLAGSRRPPPHSRK